MIKKSILLFLALLLPVSIFLFLHFFGKNEFEIPVYYQGHSDDFPAICNIDYQFPYKVNDSSIQFSGTVVIFFASGLSEEVLRESIFQLGRLDDAFGTRSPQLIILIKETDQFAQLAGAITFDSSLYSLEQKCIFLAGTNPLVLVDSDKQIRGLYPGTSLKEVDRLILELKILFKDY